MIKTAVHKQHGDIHFDAIFDYASISIVVTDSEGLITLVNPFALREFGYTAPELKGRRIEVLIPPRFRQRHQHFHDQYIAAPATRMIGEGKEIFALRKDGSEFPVQVNLSNYNKHGENYVIAFISDITTQKKAEAESNRIKTELESLIAQHTHDLEEALRQLRISEKELRQINIFRQTLLDNAGAIIVSVDTHGIIQTFNQEAEKELGYKAAELVGKHSPVIFHDTALLAQRARESGRKSGGGVDFLLQNVREGIPNEEEWIYVRKDGSHFPVRLNITPILDEKNSITGFIGVAIDISKTKKIEQELQQALEKEKELGELKSRFVSMASHEFRTPLSTVLTSAYLIEQYMNTEDHPKRQVHLKRILSAVNMLTDILNDFLSVGKIEEGRIQVRNTRFPLPAVVNNIITEMQGSLKKGQTVSYTHEGPGEVIMDSNLLKHIIMNLVSNASKFSGESSPIEIETVAGPELVTIKITDHGIGIPEEDQQHLMERFFRGANALNIQGTGLGLHIVSKYAELMNGKVECHSELDKGTSFVIHFHIKQPCYEKDTAH